MSELKNPITINKGIGSIIGNRKFYTAESVVLNTHFGEVIVASSSVGAIVHVSNSILPPSFKLDINAAQTIAIFDARHVTSDGARDKLTEQNKMLREFVKSMKLDGADEIRRMILLEDIKC